MLTWMIWIKPFSTLLMPIINLISPNIGETVKERTLMGQCGIYTNKIFYPKIISGMEDTEVLAITMYQIHILCNSATLFLVGHGNEPASNLFLCRDQQKLNPVCFTLIHRDRVQLFLVCPLY